MFTLFHVDSKSILAPRAMFKDGQAAARAARLLSLKTGSRYQPRRHVEAAVDWREREKARFESGEYTPLCSALSDQLESRGLHDLFAHVAKKRPGLIAFTKDAEKGAADKQSLRSIRAFVESYCEGACEELREHIINEQTAWANQQETELKFATTPDEITAVYVDYDSNAGAVSQSCMRYNVTHWPRLPGGDYCHPASIYGAGDLAIAYIQNEDGKTTHRALCWPAKKIYSRVYAPNDALHNLLKAAGYTQSSGYYGTTGAESLQGARCLRIENRNGNFVAPYLDEIGSFEDDGDNLIISNYGEIDGRNTSGESSSRPSAYCECCEERVDEDDLIYVYTDARQNDGASYCQCCAESHTFYCHGTNDTYSDSVDCVEVDGRTYTRRYAEENANYCERNGDYTFEDMTEVIIDDCGNTEWWGESAVSDDAIEYDDKWYSIDLDMRDVIIERYVPRYSRTFVYGQGVVNHNVWFEDVCVSIPQFLIDDGEVDVIENGENGRTYLSGYRDNYPVDRARLDVAQDEESALAA